LLGKAFSGDANVEIELETTAVSFPPSISGLDEIGSVLVRQFGLTYENVYTFCLADPPDQSSASFACPWLVGMSSKADGSVRIGTGIYIWIFARDHIQTLEIKVDEMLVLPPTALAPIMGWLSALPYPWCAAELALREAPQIEDLRPLLKQVRAMAPTAIWIRRAQLRADGAV
jgi:hypothetical protein